MSLLWAGNTQTGAGSVATPAAGGTIASVAGLGAGYYEAVIQLGYGSVALGGNDAPTNWRLSISWTGARGGSPINRALAGPSVINSMLPAVIVREIRIDGDMAPATIAIVAIAAGTGTYIAWLGVTPFSL